MNLHTDIRILKHSISPLIRYLKNSDLRTVELPNNLMFIDELVNDKINHISLQQYIMLIECIRTHFRSNQDHIQHLPQLSIADHGILGMAVLSGLNLRQAIHSMLRFTRLQTQLLNFELVEENQRAHINIIPQLDLGTAQNFTLAFSLATLHSCKKEVLGNDKSEDEIHCPYPEEEFGPLQQLFFDCDMHFNEEVCSISFPASQLDKKLKYSNEQSNQLLLQQCELLLSKSNNKEDYPSHVASILRSSDIHFPSIDQVATVLCISIRTLRRHLQQAGTSYKSLVDAERFSRATALLKYSDCKIIEIAHSLGYSDSSNFTKAFKRYTGMSPQECRLKTN